MRESRLVKTFASSCIDTSDGLFSGLNTVAEINGTGYIIESVPYSGQCRKPAQSLSLPIELFFFGECGEYELLFTVPSDREKDMLAQVKADSLEFIKIGTITHSGKKTLITDNREMDIRGFSIRARDYDDIHKYTDKVCEWLKGKI
jgi:thiamine-monophosphate kinase